MFAGDDVTETMDRNRNADASADPAGRGEGRIAALERELRKREERIQDLERRLSEARNLEEVADRLSREMLQRLADHSATDEWSPDPQGRSDPNGHRYEDRSRSIARRDAKDAGGASAGSGAGSESLRGASRSPGRLVSRLRNEVLSLDPLALEMLRHYRDHGPTTPQEAHAAAGGSGERIQAYATNRQLRERRLVEHVGRGHHDYALPALVAEESTDPLSRGGDLSGGDRDRIVRAVETAFVDGVERRDGMTPDNGAESGLGRRPAQGIDGVSTGGVDDGSAGAGGEPAETNMYGFSVDGADGSTEGDVDGLGGRTRPSEAVRSSDENGTDVLDSFGPWPEG